MELCIAVATHLPTPIVLNARHTSRSFWHVFDSQQFWATRFRGGSNSSQLFEAWCLKGARDWRWLYHRTIHGHMGQRLRTRKPILGLVQHITAILELYWNRLPTELPLL